MGGQRRDARSTIAELKQRQQRDRRFDLGRQNNQRLSRFSESAVLFELRGQRVAALFELPPAQLPCSGAYGDGFRCLGRMGRNAGQEISRRSGG